MAETEWESWGWDRLFSEVQRFVLDIDGHLGRSSEMYAIYAVERMEVCLSSLRTLADFMDHYDREGFEEEEIQIISAYRDDLHQLLACLESIVVLWENYYHDLVRADSIAVNAYQTPTLAPLPHTRGRPPYLISQDQVEYLNSLGFTWTEMSVLLGVSRMTLYRRRRDYGMLDDAVHPISDDELREVMRSMRLQHPSYGETMAVGHVRSLGYKVSRARLRAAIHYTDPIQTALRWQGGLTVRRPYSVPGPNSLWHIGMDDDNDSTLTSNGRGGSSVWPLNHRLRRVVKCPQFIVFACRLCMIGWVLPNTL